MTVHNGLCTVYITSPSYQNRKVLVKKGKLSPVKVCNLTYVTSGHKSDSQYCIVNAFSVQIDF